MDKREWDVNVSQTMAALRMNMNESIGLSSFKYLYVREPVLPLDILLKPWEKYMGTETWVIVKRTT